MPFSSRHLLLVAALAVALVASGCGSDGGAGDVPGDAIAVVGEREIPKADFERLLSQAERTYKARKQDFPKAGTPEYEQLKGAIVKSLVEQEQFAQGAEELGIEVSDADVDKRLDELKQQFFQGNEQKYQQEIEKQGLTEEQIRNDIRQRLLSERIFEEVTKDVKVSDQEVEAFYEENKADFEQPASRDVRHILVEKKPRADQLYSQIKGGADFAQLAKKFSQDTTSKDQGGKFSAQKGQTVPPFDRTVFELETGELSRPVKTQFGWHIIEAVSAIKPASTRPLSEVEKDIRQQLLQQKQNEALNQWVEDLKESFEGKVEYAPGYRPAPDETTTGGETDTSTTG